MAGNSSSGNEDGMIVGINVTPLVDITLVLLIIFMVTASVIVTPAVEVELPRAATAEPTPESTLSLVLDRQERLFLNGKQATAAELDLHIARERAKNPELQAIIAADRSVSHGAVVQLIDRIKLAGVVKFALNTKMDEEL